MLHSEHTLRTPSTVALLPHVSAAPQSALGLPFANLAWALSNWQASPSPAWLAQFVGAAARHLPVMRPRSLAVLVLGLADLGYQPDRVRACFILLMLDASCACWKEWRSWGGE